MGGHTRRQRARHHVDGMVRAAGPRQPRAVPAQRRHRARTDRRQPRRQRRDEARRDRSRDRGGADHADRHLLLAMPEPCVSRAIMRRGRRPRRRRNDLDVVAGDLRAARHAVARVRPDGGQGARGVRRGIRIVWHQRRRPRGGRRRAAVEDDWAPGTRAVVAAGRARLGPEGAAAAARSACRRRAQRPDRRLGHAHVDSGQPSGRADPAGGGGGGHRPGQRPRLGRDLRERRPAVYRRSRACDRELDARHAPQPVQPARPGQTRERVRGRRVHRRDRRGVEGRCPRVPDLAAQRPAGARGDCARVNSLRLGTEALAKSADADQARWSGGGSPTPDTSRARTTSRSASSSR